MNWFSCFSFGCHLSSWLYVEECEFRCANMYVAIYPYIASILPTCHQSIHPSTSSNIHLILSIYLSFILSVPFYINMSEGILNPSSYPAPVHCLSIHWPSHPLIYPLILICILCNIHLCIVHPSSITHTELFLVPASVPQLVQQRLWYVLSCLGWCI